MVPGGEDDSVRDYGATLAGRGKRVAIGEEIPHSSVYLHRRTHTGVCEAVLR